MKFLTTILAHARVVVVVAHSVSLMLPDILYRHYKKRSSVFKNSFPKLFLPRNTTTIYHLAFLILFLSYSSV